MENLSGRLSSLRLKNDIETQYKKVGPEVPPKRKNFMATDRYNLSEPCEASTQDRKNENSKIPLYSNVTPLPQPKVDCALRNNSKTEKVMYSNIQAVNKKPEPHVYSNINTYGNVPAYNALDHNNILDDLPPPPPEPIDYGQSTSATFPPPPEDFPPPPSPVSSSYSELRRAAEFQSQTYAQDYGNYGTSSRSSSAYESIYEPINPRPPSELSSHSNYSLYGSASTTGAQRASAQQSCNEAEVDTLTDLLIDAMEIPHREMFGECCTCGKKIVVEDSGYTAMGKDYHISCFTCCHCGTALQGKPFYSLDGKPCCEEGYLETLEKCSVCSTPILDRILRATGHPYHPCCFTCVICGKSLDGIPFTVDAANQIYCIPDFHKKFAPRCCVCKQPIMPEPGKEETVRIVALDRSFHTGCYKCEDCGLILSSKGHGCYPLDDHILCQSCNAKRVQALTSVMTTEL